MFEKLRDKVKNLSGRAKSAIASGAVGALALASNTMTAHAAISEDLKTALSTAFDGVKTDAMSLFTLALPAALAIMGVSLAITLGIKFFKKFSK